MTTPPTGHVNRFIREILIPLAGLGGIANEAVVRTGEIRITAMLVFVSMIGLPPFINSEHVSAVLDVVRRRNGNGQTTDDAEKPPTSSFAITRLAGRF